MEIEQYPSIIRPIPSAPPPVAPPSYTIRYITPITHPATDSVPSLTHSSLSSLPPLPPQPHYQHSPPSLSVQSIPLAVDSLSALNSAAVSVSPPSKASVLASAVVSVSPAPSAVVSSLVSSPPPSASVTSFPPSQPHLPRPLYSTVASRNVVASVAPLPPTSTPVAVSSSPLGPSSAPPPVSTLSSVSPRSGVVPSASAAAITTTAVPSDPSPAPTSTRSFLVPLPSSPLPSPPASTAVMEQDESEAVVVAEVREEEMGQEEEKREMAVEEVATATAQEMMASDERVGVESVATVEKRAKESDEEGKSSTSEEEEVKGETWLEVQAKRQKLAGKKKKAKAVTFAPGVSDGLSGEGKKAERETIRIAGVEMDVISQCDGGGENFLHPETESHRLWTLSQLSLPSSVRERAVRRPSQAPVELLPLLTLATGLTAQSMEDFASQLPPQSSPFSDPKYVSGWRRAITRLVLTPRPLTPHALAKAIMSIPAPPAQL